MSPAVTRRLSSSTPAVLMVGDLVWLEGRPCAPLPYRGRRARLEELGLGGPSWQVNPDHPGEGTALLAAARAQGLPGILAKRLDSPYRPGETSPDWVLVAV
jgi:bifunctional non-homologous end joining protein LigD